MVRRLPRLLTLGFFTVTAQASPPVQRFCSETNFTAPTGSTWHYNARALEKASKDIVLVTVLKHEFTDDPASLKADSIPAGAWASDPPQKEIPRRRVRWTFNIEESLKGNLIKGTKLERVYTEQRNAKLKGMNCDGSVVMEDGQRYLLFLDVFNSSAIQRIRGKDSKWLNEVRSLLTK